MTRCQVWAVGGWAIQNNEAHLMQISQRDEGLVDGRVAVQEPHIFCQFIPSYLFEGFF